MKPVDDRYQLVLLDIVELFTEDAFSISNELDSEGSMLIEIAVSGSDAGKLIGSQGRNIRTLEELMRAATKGQFTSLTIKAVPYD